MKSGKVFTIIISIIVGFLLGFFVLFIFNKIDTKEANLADTLDILIQKDRKLVKDIGTPYEYDDNNTEILRVRTEVERNLKLIEQLHVSANENMTQENFTTLYNSLLEVDTSFSYLEKPIKGLKKTKFKDKDNNIRLKIIELSILQKIIEKYIQESLLITKGEVLNVAKRDTIRLGETYSSQWVFSVLDIDENEYFYLKKGDLKFDSDLDELLYIVADSNLLRYGKFEEKPTKRGVIKHKGVFHLNRGYGKYAYFPFEFEYYVK